MNLFYIFLCSLCMPFLCAQAKVEIELHPSKNFDQRKVKKQIVKPNYIILHYTANCDRKSAIAWLKNSFNPVSAHFVIGVRGTISQTVDPDNRAWHAGDSWWKGNTEMNAYSIGIEIVNPGATEEKKDPCTQTPDDPWDKDSGIQLPGSNQYWYPFTKTQIKSLIELCKELMQKYQIPPQNILGHSDIAPHRKLDPGPLMPWRLLAQNNIGVWPDTVDEVKNYSIQEIQTMLQRFGYKIKITGKLDKQTTQVLKAFQMHFRPANIDGSPDNQSGAILASLTT